MEYEGNKITRKELKEVVEEVFRSERVTSHFRWYENLSIQQREAVDKIFKAEVEKQLEAINPEKITFKSSKNKFEGGKASPFTLDEVGHYPFDNDQAWWNNPNNETNKLWNKVRKMKYKSKQKKNKQ